MPTAVLLGQHNWHCGHSFPVRINQAHSLRPSLALNGYEGRHPRRPLDCPRALARQLGTFQPVNPRSRIQTHASAEAGSFDDGLGANFDSPKLQTSAIFNRSYDKDIANLAIPALGSMLLDPIMSAINTAVVGRLGTQSLAATSLGAMTMSFAALVFSFMIFLTTPRVAAAVASNDKDRVSKTSSMGLWLAGVCGVLMSLLTFFNATAIVAVFNAPEVAVATNAALYIKGRCVGLTAVLFNFTCAGIYRGFKDTRTPLYASVASALISVPLNLVLIYGFNMGVLGAAVATSIVHWVSSFTLIGLLIYKDRLRIPDMLTPPPFRDILPILQSGSLLSLRSIVSFGLILYASTLCVRAGSTVQSSFEVVRQLWILTIQFFECLNVACQALCASYLGAQDWRRAREVLLRIMLLGTTSASIVGLALSLAHLPIIALFSKDPEVLHQVQRTIPMLCLTFPMDALASILEGSLFAAQQTNFITYVQIGGAALQYVALLAIIRYGTVDVLAVWSVLKLLTAIRLIAAFFRVFMSRRSAYGPNLTATS